jgi:hypothetical protein
MNDLADFVQPGDQNPGLAFLDPLSKARRAPYVAPNPGFAAAAAADFAELQVTFFDGRGPRTEALIVGQADLTAPGRLADKVADLVARLHRHNPHPDALWVGASYPVHSVSVEVAT